MSTGVHGDQARTTLSCPRCRTGRLDPAATTDGFTACPHCGHGAATGYVAEALWLEQQDGLLHARLDWVLARVTAGDARAEPMVHPAPGTPAPARRPVEIQAVLLSGGALLLVVAAVVFAAVAWDRLGAGGQIAVLVTLVAALSAAAHGLRASYRSTAEALAAIAAGVAAVALLAAPRLGLGSDWMRERPAAWAAVAFALLTVLAVVLARASRLVAWRVTSAAALVAAAFSAALAAGGGSSIAPLGCAGLAVAATAVLLVPPDRSRGYRGEATWAGAGLGGLAVIAGLAGYQHLDQAAAWAGAWSVVGLGAVLLVVPPRGAGPVTGMAGPVAAVVAGLAVGQVPPLLAAGWSLDRWVAVPGLALCGAALLGAADTVPGTRDGTASGTVPSTRSHRLGLAGDVAAATLWIASLPVLAASGTVSAAQASVYLGIVACSLLALSFMPGRVALAWIAAVVGTASLWVLLADDEVATLEVFTGSAAALLLVAGLLQRRVRPSLGSLVVLGPALGMLALPSALLALAQAPTGDDPLRAALVILGGAGLAALGARLRVKAALIVGVLATVVAGLGQVLALVHLVPRWVALAVAGTLLLLAGFSTERLGRAGRHAWRATRQMR